MKKDYRKDTRSCVWSSCPGYATLWVYSGHEGVDLGPNWVRRRGRDDNRPQQYRFTSSSLIPGTRAFRLKQIDQDGTTYRTEVRRVAIRPQSGGPRDRADPLRRSDDRDAGGPPQSAGNRPARRHARSGRQEHGPMNVRDNARSQTPIDGSRLSAGSYLLRVDGETFTATRRVMHVR